MTRSHSRGRLSPKLPFPNRRGGILIASGNALTIVLDGFIRDRTRGLASSITALFANALLLLTIDILAVHRGTLLTLRLNGSGVLVLILLMAGALWATSGGVGARRSARRREIRLMQLLGARLWMIRIPLMLEAVVLSIGGGFVAITVSAATFNNRPWYVLLIGLLIGLLSYLVAQVRLRFA